MEVVKPFVHCIDYWPVHIPEACLDAYKQMIEAGQIRRRCVVYNRRNDSTIVEYYANQPHEWIKEEMRELVGGQP